jgi:hypothetical protein
MTEERKPTVSPNAIALPFRAGLSHMSKELEEEVFAPHGGAHFSADGFGRGVQAQDVLGQSSDDGEVLGRGLGGVWQTASGRVHEFITLGECW